MISFIIARQHPYLSVRIVRDSPKTILWFAKKFGISHMVFNNLADGKPQVEGLGVPAVISVGIAARKKDPSRAW